MLNSINQQVLHFCTYIRICFDIYPQSPTAYSSAWASRRTPAISPGLVDKFVMTQMTSDSISSETINMEDFSLLKCTILICWVLVSINFLGIWVSWLLSIFILTEDSFYLKPNKRNLPLFYLKKKLNYISTTLSGSILLARLSTRRLCTQFPNVKNWIGNKAWPGYFVELEL